MIANKIFITIISLILLGFALCKMDVKENFINVHQTYKVDGVVDEPNVGMFSIPGYFQSMLAPRFSNVNYGSNIRYNMPSVDNQGVPCNPLTYGNMVGGGNTKENYCYNCGGGCKSPPDCGKGGLGPASNAVKSWAQDQMYASKDFKSAMNKLEYTDTTDMLPVGDMKTVNAMGGPQQAIVYDRFMYANQRSRLYALGDPIRGDLPIVPCKNEWFRPSVHPHIDLRDGAMQVMGGVDNSTSNELHALQSLNTAGTYTTMGGINYATQKQSALGIGQRDLQVTSFP